MKMLEFILKVQQISKIGLLYSKDPYAVENYTELEKLSKDMLNEHTDLSIQKNIFEKDIYPTPNSSVRVLVVNDKDEVLMVKETSDHKYALPGGWCEIYENLKDNAMREVFEEAGMSVKIEKLLCIYRHEFHLHDDSIMSEYAHYFLARPLNDTMHTNHETEDVSYFKIDELPTLSRRNTKNEILKAYEVYKNQLDTYFE